MKNLFKYVLFIGILLFYFLRKKNDAPGSVSTGSSGRDFYNRLPTLEGYDWKLNIHTKPEDFDGSNNSTQDELAFNKFSFDYKGSNQLAPYSSSVPVADTIFKYSYVYDWGYVPFNVGVKFSNSGYLSFQEHISSIILNFARFLHDSSTPHQKSNQKDAGDSNFIGISTSLLSPYVCKGGSSLGYYVENGQNVYYCKFV